jgi:hypothetical protein
MTLRAKGDLNDGCMRFWAGRALRVSTSILAIAASGAAVVLMLQLASVKRELSEVRSLQEQTAAQYTEASVLSAGLRELQTEFAEKLGKLETAVQRQAEIAIASPCDFFLQGVLSEMTDYLETLSQEVSFLGTKIREVHEFADGQRDFVTTLGLGLVTPVPDAVGFPAGGC